MKYPGNIVDLMGDLVNKVNTNLLASIQEANSDVTSIRYVYGHPQELIQRIRQRMENPEKKDDIWPLVMLYTDIPHKYGDNGGYYAEVTLELVIAYCTSPDLKAADRLEKNFKPILLPIYQELMKQINRSGYFAIQSQKQIPHTKWDRYFWGKTGNVFNDYIDAIQIENLRLKLTKNGNEKAKAIENRYHDNYFDAFFN